MRDHPVLLSSFQKFENPVPRLYLVNLFIYLVSIGAGFTGTIPGLIELRSEDSKTRWVSTTSMRYRWTGRPPHSAPPKHLSDLELSVLDTSNYNV